MGYSTEEIVSSDINIRYQLLGRMQSDCVYCIQNNFISSHLWGVTVQEHIKFMKAIWKSFPKEKKPNWLGYKTICSYEKQMLAIAKSDKGLNGENCDFCNYVSPKVNSATGGVDYYCSLLRKDVKVLRNNKECPLRK